MAFLIYQMHKDTAYSFGTNGELLREVIQAPWNRPSSNFIFQGMARYDTPLTTVNWFNLGNYSTAAGTSGTSGTTVGGGNYTWVG